MRTYFIRRLLLMIPTLFLLSILVFLSVRFIPGDIVDIMVAKMHGWGGGYTNREALERVLGLDVPVHVQYGRWIGVLPTPDWKTGESQFQRYPPGHPWQITVCHPFVDRGTGIREIASNP